jgi:hypothetical protein
LAIIRLPKSENNDVDYFIIENYIGNHVQYINGRLGSVKPSWDLLCVQVDRLNFAPSNTQAKITIYLLYRLYRIQAPTRR